MKLAKIILLIIAGTVVVTGFVDYVLPKVNELGVAFWQEEDRIGRAENDSPGGTNVVSNVPGGLCLVEQDLSNQNQQLQGLVDWAAIVNETSRLALEKAKKDDGYDAMLKRMEEQAFQQFDASRRRLDEQHADLMRKVDDLTKLVARQHQEIIHLESLLPPSTSENEKKK